MIKQDLSEEISNIEKDCYFLTSADIDYSVRKILNKQIILIKKLYNRIVELDLNKQNINKQNINSVEGWVGDYQYRD